jgi:bacterioferritin
MKSHKIIELLETAYAGELETVENYLANSVWLDGLQAEEAKESLRRDVTEELGHAQRLAARLKQLGACPPGSLKLARTQKSLQPPAKSTDIMAVVRGVITAEEDAIALYKQISKACEGRDEVTQHLAIELLADEEEHRCLFVGFLRSLEDHEARHAVGK